MGEIGKIGFIGAGKMGSALIAGVLKAGLAEPSGVFITEPNEEACARCCETYGVIAVPAGELVARCRVAVLCVKPAVIISVLKEVGSVLGPDKLLISVAAGITTGKIEAELMAAGAVPVVRAMPNIAATVGQSATAVAGGNWAGKEDIDLARRILSSAGLVVELPESLLDAVTGLSGSGPAYVFLFIEALINGGLKVGLPPAEARTLALQTVKGAVAVLEEDKDAHPATMRDAVTTPAGTTIAGLHELDQRNFREAVICAVEAATKRSRELGEEKK